jgi:predicted nucleic acid-binding protein
MSGARVFVDTAALRALIHPADELHAHAVDVQRRIARNRARLVISDWVLTEFLGGAADRRLRSAAISLVQRLQASPNAEIVAASRSEWSRAFDLYRARGDKDWSFVDCTSILIFQDRGIQDVFSHDRHFTQAGLRILLE